MGSILTVDTLAVTVKQVILSSLLYTVVTLRTFTQIGIDVGDQVSLFISHPLDFLAHSTIGAVDITPWLHEKDEKGLFMVLYIIHITNLNKCLLSFLWSVIPTKKKSKSVNYQAIEKSKKTIEYTYHGAH